MLNFAFFEKTCTKVHLSAQSVQEHNLWITMQFPEISISKQAQEMLFRQNPKQFKDFNLHRAANLAREMGGALFLHSQDVQGVILCLELPKFTEDPS